MVTSRQASFATKKSARPQQAIEFERCHVEALTNLARREHAKYAKCRWGLDGWRLIESMKVWTKQHCYG